MTIDPMQTRPTDQSTDSAVRFIQEWSIFRKHILAYPAHHPILQQTGEKIDVHLADLFHHQTQIDFGVMKQDLIYNTTALQPLAPQTSRLAEDLYQLGIAVFSLHSGLDWHELSRFCQFIHQGPESVETSGGLEKALQSHKLAHITVTPFDFSVLHTTDQNRVKKSSEETEPDFWRQLVQGLMDNTLGTGGTESATDAELLPKSYADILNRRFSEVGTDALSTAEMTQIFPALVGQQSSRGSNPVVHQRLSSFIQHLHPDVRRQFLEGGIDVLGEEADFMQEMVADLPPSMIRELMDAEKNLAATGKEPPLLKMLQQLGAHGDMPLPGQLNLEASPAAISAVRTIFREDESELYVPQAYQAQLSQLLQTDSEPTISPVQLRGLIDTLEVQHTEPKVCTIILEVVKQLPRDQQPEVLARHLGDISRYFLDMGDFNALYALHQRLQTGMESATDEEVQVRRSALSIFTDIEFIEDLLASLGIWGKGKYKEVQRLIVAIGIPAVDPLLDALAAEESMSLRRYYMECLTRIGPGIRPHLQARLQDTRWYLLRNLIVLLRGLKTPAVLDGIEPLLRHAHLRVRQETLRTFLQFNDTRGLRSLLAELNSDDMDRQLAAIRLAEQVKSPMIVRHLIGLLSTKDLNDSGLKKQIAIIRALGEIAHNDALPALKQLLESRSLFRATAQNQMKAEVCRSLAHFNAPMVMPLLQTHAQSRTSVIADAARNSLNSLRKRTT